jgi:hypothetical protein
VSQRSKVTALILRLTRRAPEGGRERSGNGGS